MNQWASGALTAETEFKTATLNAAALRECQVLEELLTPEIEDLFRNEE